MLSAVQAVPGKLSRYGLSQVINGLLDLGEQAYKHPYDLMPKHEAVDCVCNLSVTAMAASSKLKRMHWAASAGDGSHAPCFFVGRDATAV
jgi:anaerobic glycerol-3-phosphate dehydrogenase